MDLNALNNLLDQLDVDKDPGTLAEEGMEEEGEAIWNHYREYGPADLQAIVRDLTRRIRRRSGEANLRILLSRLAVALNQLHVRVIHLQKPSKHGDLPSSVPPWMKDEFGEEKVEAAGRNQHIWAEYHKRKDEAESATQLQKDIAEKYDLSRSRVAQIVKGD